MRTALLLWLFATPIFAQSWSIQTSGLDSNLRGVAVAATSPSSGLPVVWACGSHDVILRSSDGGKTWARRDVPGATSLDFRSVQAFGAAIAYVMSIGPGPASRIYKTSDAGKHWTLEYTAKRDTIFLDDLVCVSKADCYALGDPVDGKFLLLHTRDGNTWQELPRNSMPAALPGEGVFAASGTSLSISESEIYFVTGGARTARVFRSTDMGRSWSVSATPIVSGNASSGIFSIAQEGNAVVIVGGDYRSVGNAAHVAAYSLDRGTTWNLAASGPHGFRSAVAFAGRSLLIAVGPNGEDISRDDGAHWTVAGSLNLNAIAVSRSRLAWAVGHNGMIASMQIQGSEK